MEIANYLASEVNQRELIGFMNRQFKEFSERVDIIEFKRNQILLEFIGDDEIEYGFLPALFRFFQSEDIDCIEYSLNVQYGLKDENWMVNMEISLNRVEN